MAASIVVLGSTNWDIAMQLPRLPSAKETITGGRVHACLGGKGANQSVAALRAGGNTLFITALGDDAISATVRSALLDQGLDKRGLLTLAGAETGQALIFVDDQAENCIGVASGANGLLNESHLLPFQSVISQADYLLMQLEIPLETVTAAARLAKAANTRVILNPAPVGNAPLSDALLADIDLLTPNQVEISQLTGMPVQSTTDLKAAAGFLLDKGLATLIVTLGAEGVLVANQETMQVLPAYSVQAVDTTAAGDVFNGALVAALADGAGLLDAVAFGSAAAALSVTQMGAIPSIPTRDQITRFIGDHANH